MIDTLRQEWGIGENIDLFGDPQEEAGPILAVFEGDRPFQVAFGEVAGDVEPHAGAVFFFLGREIGLKDALCVLGGNPAAVVADAPDDLVVFPGGRDRDDPAVFPVLRDGVDGVVEEDQKRLYQRIFAGDKDMPIIDLLVEGYIVFLQKTLEQDPGFIHQGRCAEPFDLVSRAHEVPEIVDRLRQILERPVRLFIVGFEQFQGEDSEPFFDKGVLQHEGDDVERLAPLVGDDLDRFADRRLPGLVKHDLLALSFGFERFFHVGSDFADEVAHRAGHERGARAAERERLAARWSACSLGEPQNRHRLVQETVGFLINGMVELPVGIKTRCRGKMLQPQRLLLDFPSHQRESGDAAVDEERFHRVLAEIIGMGIRIGDNPLAVSESETDALPFADRPCETERPVVVLDQYRPCYRHFLVADDHRKLQPDIGEAFGDRFTKIAFVDIDDRGVVQLPDPVSLRLCDFEGPSEADPVEVEAVVYFEIIPEEHRHHEPLVGASLFGKDFRLFETVVVRCHPTGDDEIGQHVCDAVYEDLAVHMESL